MNRPDKAGEPSMEEILASIRQIIADDPPSERGAAVVEPNPLVPQSAVSEASRLQEASTPLVDRLSDVLKSGPLPPTSPFGSKRPLSFDQDLADMFEETGDGAATPLPKPDLRVPFEPSSTVKASAGSASAEEPTVAAALDEAPGSPSFDALSSSAPSVSSAETPSIPALTAGAPLVPPMPFGGVSAPTISAPEPPAPPPPKSFGFPPLRKQSFYPPQPKTPELPPLPAKEPETEMPTARADDEGGLDKAIERLSGLGAVVPGQITVPGQGTLNGSGASAFGSLGLSATSDTAPPNLTMPDLSVPPDFIARDPQPAAAAPPVVESVIAEAVDPFPSFAAKPADPAPLPALDPAFGAEATPSAVAAQALDALAFGLAASAASNAAQTAIPLTPVVEPPETAQPINVGAAPNPHLPATTQAAPQGRTLEDAVAEMLRPMLQQWVSDNMPRIIEKALRNEVARTVKPDPSSRS